ncbi:MAG TPA: energy-coupling factor transporter transmembrane protein EcfT [Deltaproteobacteria bacterium]|nr:energy-coupling factor transporter transmembrane protein EcfT [Deltaproteobacteria bacterium]
MKEYGALHNAFQYQYRDSVIHRLGGGWKLLSVIVFCALAIASRSWSSLAVLFAVLIGLYFAAKLGFRGLWADLRLFLIQVPIIVGLYAIKNGIPAGLIPGANKGLQILLFFLPGALFLRTTPSSQIMAGLKRFLPSSLVFLIVTSFRFVPFFVREIEEIALMQRLRGAAVAPKDLANPRNWKDLFDCLFIPLLIRAIKTAEEAGLSAEARGLGGTARQKALFNRINADERG